MDASVMVQPAARVRGRVRPPGDKSISHRYALLAAIADGPSTIHGAARLQPIDFEPEVPSAQVKSAVLLAGLHAEGVTSVLEPLPTRDHTERALQAFGVPVAVDGETVALTGGQR